MTYRNRIFICSPNVLLLSVLLILSIISQGCTGKNSGQEKKELFLKYQEAVQNEDLETLKEIFSEDALGELENTGIDFKTAMGMVKAFSPSQVEIKKPLPSGEEEDLVLEASGEGFENSKGTVSFIREEGILKIAKVSWEIAIEFGEGNIGLIWDPDYKIDLGGWLSKAPNLGKIDRKYLIASSNVFRPLPTPFLKGEGKIPQPVQILKTGGPLDRMVFSTDGNFLLTAGYGDYIIRVWDAMRGVLLDDVEMNQRPTSIAVSPLGDLFVTGDAYSFLNFWKIQFGQIESLLTINADAGVQLRIAISDNASLLATVSHDKFLSIWSLEEKRLLTKVRTPYGLNCVAFSPAGPVLAAGTYTNKFILWDLSTGKGRVFTVPKVDETSSVTAVSFSPDGNYLLTGHTESSITVWNVREQKQVHNFFVPNAATMSVAFSPDGLVFATAQANKLIYIWDSRTAKQLAMLRGHGDVVQHLAFSPDGSKLASTSDDETVIIWE